MKQITLTDAQAKAVLVALDLLAKTAPEGARAIIDCDVMRSVYFQLKTQTIAAAAAGHSEARREAAERRQRKAGSAIPQRAATTI